MRDDPGYQIWSGIIPTVRMDDVQYSTGAQPCFGGGLSLISSANDRTVTISLLALLDLRVWRVECYHCYPDNSAGGNALSLYYRPAELLTPDASFDPLTGGVTPTSQAVRLDDEFSDGAGLVVAKEHGAGVVPSPRGMPLIYGWNGGSSQIEYHASNPAVFQPPREAILQRGRVLTVAAPPWGAPGRQTFLFCHYWWSRDERFS